MKSLVSIWKELADELASWCRTSTAEDCKTVLSRVEDEGLSFLTITLPKFGKSFEICLDKGKVDFADFAGFKRSKSRGPLPIFLGGFLSRIFDSASGDILPDPCLDAIFAVRQLTLVYGKINLDCADFRTRKAFRQYVETDRETQRIAGCITDQDRQDLSLSAILLFGDTFGHLDASLHRGEPLVPKHGPGATAERLSSNQKYSLRYWPERLERVFSFAEYALPSASYWSEVVDRHTNVPISGPPDESSFCNDDMDHVHFPEPGDEIPVRVISVPKTLQTPRIIAIEPASMQYMQQAVLEPMTQLLESQRIPGNTRDNPSFGMIGFRDQNPNRLLACSGSKSRHLATLDLSEASDRVSTVHVEALLSNYPLLREAVFATRSSKAQVPGHGVVPLAKFASMGSALCFPIEAMVFLSVVMIGIARGQGAHLSPSFIKKYRDSVRVYGDDIIVPVDSVHHVIEALELFGFKVNTNKSFWTGKFRESCGGDYYDGTDVTPVRLRRLVPRSRAEAAEVQSIVAFRNLMYNRGLWKTARYLDSIVGKVLPHYPAVGPDSSVLGRHAFSGYDIQRMHPELHSPLVKGYVAVPRIPSDPLDGWPALLKFFLKRSDEPLQEGHLQRQGRPQAVDIKLGWKKPF